MSPCVRLYAVVLTVVSCCVSAAALPKPISATMCDIHRNPAEFHGRVVQIRATLARGFEIGGLMDPQHPHCGFIDLQIVGTDGSLAEFIRLSSAEVEPIDSPGPPDLGSLLVPPEGALTGQGPAATCPEVTGTCRDCYFRYKPLSATFTGKLRYADKEPGKAGFGFGGVIKVRLDVRSVAAIHTTDRLGRKFDPKCWKATRAAE
jgi:hypothetical protein